MEFKALVDKNKILNLTVIIVAFIIASSIYRQQSKELESLKSKNSMEIKKNTVIENISKMESSINAYKKILAKKDAGSVINTLTNIARESGMKITSVRPLSEKRYPDYIKSPFSLMLSAPNYHALGAFISKTESYQDVYIVEAIEIRSQGQAKELAVDLTISAIAFIL